VCLPRYRHTRRHTHPEGRHTPPPPTGPAVGSDAGQDPQGVADLYADLEQTPRRWPRFHRLNLEGGGSGAETSLSRSRESTADSAAPDPKGTPDVPRHNHPRPRRSRPGRPAPEPIGRQSPEQLARALVQSGRASVDILEFRATPSPDTDRSNRL